MPSDYVNMKARYDFNKAKQQATISGILSALTPHKQNLLSLEDVRKLVKPKSETYRGMQIVPVDKIVGSEGRYQDFSRAFLPKYEYLRHRWENIDKAHHNDVILPPVKLYQISNVYFVRDGNHRVSVARMQGQMEIDAEVIELTSEIEVSEDMTVRDLEDLVIAYEKDRVFKETRLGEIIPGVELQFTEPGRFIEILRHIQGHKYFINMDVDEEIPFVEAGRSWYESIYKPIIDIIRSENYVQRFPNRTESDLYMWIVQHWDSLKQRYGADFSLEMAADDYSRSFGKGLFSQFKDMLVSWIKNFRKP